jgi:HEAT repeat protein
VPALLKLAMRGTLNVRVREAIKAVCMRIGQAEPEVRFGIGIGRFDEPASAVSGPNKPVRQETTEPGTVDADSKGKSIVERNPDRAKPLTELSGNELEQALDDLQSSESNRRAQAIGRLETVQPASDPELRRQIAATLEAVLADTRKRQAAARALGVCGTKETLPVLINAISDENVLFRGIVIRALGSFDDERAADAVAESMIDWINRGEARAALTRQSTWGEKAVLKLLGHPDTDVRQEAMKLLKVIGTSESVSALNEQLKDSDRGISHGAQDVLDAIKARG